MSRPDSMTKDEIKNRLEYINDEISELEAERDELMAATKRNLADPYEEGSIVIGSVCASCGPYGVPQFKSKLCSDCEKKAKILLKQGIQPEAISMKKPELTQILAGLQKAGGLPL